MIEKVSSEFPKWRKLVSSRDQNMIVRDLYLKDLCRITFHVQEMLCLSSSIPAKEGVATQFKYHKLAEGYIK